MKKFKSVLSFLLVLCVMVSALPVAASAAGNLPFVDVKAGDWYTDAVQYVYDNNLMVGVNDTHFGPGQAITRSMIVTILYRMDGSPQTSGSSKFTDLEQGSWYENAVAWGAANGIVEGTSPTSFNPKGKITREQMVLFLYRYAQYKDYGTGSLADLEAFTDAGTVSSWAETAMRWAVGDGILNGVTENAIAPKGTATRAQIAAIFMRFCQKQDAYARFKEKDVEDFPDAEVINLDASNETNFAVLTDDTVAVESSGQVNRLVEMDQENGLYRLANIDDDVAALRPGNIFYHVYGRGEADFILIKVGTIDFDGTTATITSADPDPDEIFQYMDIDMDMEVPASAVALRAEDAQQFGLDRAYFVPENFKNQDYDTKFHFSENIAGLNVDASSTITLHITWEKDGKDINRVVATVKTDSNISAGFELRTDNTPLYADTPAVPVAGNKLVTGSVSAYLTFNSNAGVSGTVKGEIRTESGFERKNGKVSRVEDFSKELSANVRGDFKANVGIGIRATLTLFHILDVNLDTEGGVDVTGAVDKTVSSEKPVEKHDCTLCLDGAVTPYIKLAGSIADSDPYEFGKHSFAGAPFYISYRVDGDTTEFGWGRCPHKSYLISVHTQNASGGRLSGIQVEVRGLDTGAYASGMTNGDGLFETYSPVGKYRVSARGHAESSASKEFTLTNQGADVTLVLMSSGGNTPGYENLLDSGECGDQGNNVQWALYGKSKYDSLLLRVTGSGRMEDYHSGPSGADNKDPAPYNQYGENIYTVEIGEGITHIGASAFRDFHTARNITIPSTVTSIGDEAFNGWNRLTNITIPSGVTSIGKSAFSACVDLPHITIPNKVTAIGDSAFSFCHSLASITIPASVEVVGLYTFNSCEKLKDVYFTGSEEQWESIKTVDPYFEGFSQWRFQDKLKNATIHYNSTGPV